MSGPSGGRSGISYCARCKAMIPAVDVESGRAVSRDDGTYCPECGNATGGEAGPDKPSPPLPAPRLKTEVQRLTGLDVGFTRQERARIDPIYASPMVLVGAGIMAAGVLALVAFIVFSARTGGAVDDARGSARQAGPPAEGDALARQRAIEVRMRAVRASPESPGTGPGSGAAGGNEKAAAVPDKPAAPPEAPQPVVRPPEQENAAARPLDAGDTAAIASRAGKTATVAGRVLSCSWSGTGKVMFVNFSGDRKSFYAVLFRNRVKDFEESFGSPPEKFLSGRNIEITGEVEIYEGRPQIRLEKPDQVKFID